LILFLLRIKKPKEILIQKKGCFWGDYKENGLNIFLAKPLNMGRLNHAEEKRKKAGKEKIYQADLNQTQ